MKSIINSEQGFPGGWYYTEPETGFTIEAWHWGQLLQRVKDHRKANNLPVARRLEQDIIDQLCARHPQACRDTEPPTVAEMTATFTKSLVKWIRGGLPCVSYEQYTARKNVCLDCPQFRGEAALGLGRCGSCGCVSVKLFLATETCPQKKW